MVKQKYCLSSRGCTVWTFLLRGVLVTEAEGSRELTQHGVLPCLAVGEGGLGDDDLYCDGRVAPPAMTHVYWEKADAPSPRLILNLDVPTQYPSLVVIHMALWVKTDLVMKIH
jgi:hypothetical protein